MGVAMVIRTPKITLSEIDWPRLSARCVWTGRGGENGIPAHRAVLVWAHSLVSGSQINLRGMKSWSRCPRVLVFLVLALFMQLTPTHPSETSLVVISSRKPSLTPHLPAGISEPFPVPPKLPVKVRSGSLLLPCLPSAWDTSPSPLDRSVVVQLLSPVQLFCDPTDCTPPGLPSMGFPRQEYWSGLSFPTIPGDLSRPGIKPKPPALAGGVFTTEPPGNPWIRIRLVYFVDLTLEPFQCSI